MNGYSLETIIFAFLITLFAGLSTGIGSSIALTSKKTNKILLAASLGFSAGVMIYVSFVEIFLKAKDSLNEASGSDKGYLFTVIAFFVGIALIAIIDWLIPNNVNPHSGQSVEDIEGRENKALLRMGLFSALAIAVHNFPEGLATFVASLENATLGISIAIAIAIHNIPEGIAVSVPIYHATGSRKKAFKWSFISGLAEPVGAIVGFLVLATFFNDFTFGIVFALVAGIMVYIAIDELLPTAEKHGEHHITIGGFVLGMLVMAVSLLVV